MIGIYNAPARTEDNWRENAVLLLNHSPYVFRAIYLHCCVLGSCNACATCCLWNVSGVIESTEAGCTQQVNVTSKRFLIGPEYTCNGSLYTVTRVHCTLSSSGGILDHAILVDLGERRASVAVMICHACAMAFPPAIGAERTVKHGKQKLSKNSQKSAPNRKLWQLRGKCSSTAFL